MHVILASSSPRRRELLEQLGLDFRVVPAHVDERLDDAETPRAAALRLAGVKAAAVAQGLGQGLVLAADTLVAVDRHVLGKPRDAAEMEAHLRLLSGRTHQVYTGVCVVDASSGRTASDVEVTDVEFDRLGEHEIRWYVASGDGLDKAGSYGYQALASVLVKRIDGCYFNVVGLPLLRLRHLVGQLGYDLLAMTSTRGNP